jgi:dienelactone hydrolase
VIAGIFHAWERRLASVDTNRVVRPFEWGLDWIGLDPSAGEPEQRLSAWSRAAMADTQRFYALGPAGRFDLAGDVLTFASPLETPHTENNTVTARVFPARRRTRRHPTRAVVVLPQWNADAAGHVGLCHLLATFGITAVRLSLPYHDARKPPELRRADYIVGANVGRTLQANRQAVLDARRAVDWLEAQGYERIGILGTSLGSCLSMLAMAHDPRIRAGALNHISPFFADVVWRGLSTAHVRAGLEGHTTLDALREYWMPISPWPFIEHVRGRPVLLIYARYDLTFPVDLSQRLVAEFRRRRVPHELVVLPCGHYSIGKAPFKYLDGYALAKFFLTNL